MKGIAINLLIVVTVMLLIIVVLMLSLSGLFDFNLAGLVPV